VQAEAAQEERGGASVIALVMKRLKLGRRLGLARPGCIVGIAVTAVRRVGQNELGDVQCGGSCAQREHRTGGVAVNKGRLAALGDERRKIHRRAPLRLSRGRDVCDQVKRLR
jgi:hypothetical protein